MLIIYLWLSSGILGFTIYCFKYKKKLGYLPKKWEFIFGAIAGILGGGLTLVNSLDEDTYKDL